MMQSLGKPATNVLSTTPAATFLLLAALLLRLTLLLFAVSPLS
jgi:hypothetical protein